MGIMGEKIIGPLGHHFVWGDLESSLEGKCTWEGGGGAIRVKAGTHTMQDGWNLNGKQIFIVIIYYS
jgi:hypothetical protein